ncbi:MAG: SGNH/GDSL hydrolase family protein [Asticcacaulis sp.]|uniref:SGNH/GDSL hydrolase family protein n=1 Tax=Asticcacaulis sp. TaxID=1872648 RepID=UPI0039E43039
MFQTTRRATLFSLALMAALPALPAMAKDAAPKWIPTWYASPEPSGVDVKIADKTLRQIVRISAGGSSVRLRLSNAYGAAPLKLEDIRVAKRLTGSRIDPASDNAVTFNGRATVTIAPGAYVLSDPLPLKVAADSDLAISLYVPEAPLATVHDIQRGVFYVADGRTSRAAELPEAKTDIGIGNAFPWLAEVEVSGSPAKAALITFGDSITDGYGITPDQGRTWPELLSRRLHEANIPLSVVNAGLSGNRLLHHGAWARFGEGGLSRFDRDVLAQPNASAVIVLIGINDLGHAQGPGSEGYVSADDLIDGLSQTAARAHERGLKIYAATMTPFRDTVFENYFSEDKEKSRQAINAWIRQQTVFDGVIDFEKAVEDPARPGHLRTEYDVGDHLHPNDAGVAAMAAVIPLGLFK